MSPCPRNRLARRVGGTMRGTSGGKSDFRIMLTVLSTFLPHALRQIRCVLEPEHMACEVE
ncbi:hypothetical protein HYPP_03007 [Hyphomicrobium sp. ghe19]|nr:hypothetical protein HYPP_03007 [Hyphomicrobium sp. ghe19]